ncbi:G-type lectin S-receptor-like serine/threonine-protein kinase At4g27290 isoform X1 [Lycium barbarum]|uniref:G-type lectin S-receptor-like serine/threonine-protein kinase At4g27290 isoform X1 n=1 Tax=Lycium barbarum TaxID=112863 RepID=UPI00293E0164|nr:G-type lectin S-receptor-like serine/threonine-protein kinase At4g27290 isoform X1 [Lycium barbarum]
MPSLFVFVFLLFCSSLKSLGAATTLASQNNSVIGDTIDANKWITIASTVVSSGGNFEMGFFTPGNNSNYYIGTWYKKLSVQTVIWVANRETPVSIYEMDFAQFKIVDGNLVLLNGTRHTIWSTNIKYSTNSNNSQVVATLFDDGNLILSNGDSKNSTNFLWTSFDHPSHTFMPGSKFGYNKRTRLKQVLTSWKSANDPSPGPFTHEVDMDKYSGQGVNMWNHSVIYWNSGPWTGNNFTGVPYQPNPMFNYTYVNNDDEVYYMYKFFNPALISRFVMDVNGQTKQFLWMDSTNAWSVFYTDPKQVCDVFAYCGAFGICNELNNSASTCDCLPGFKPKFEKDWGLNSFSSGCMRKTSLNCGKFSEKDRFWLHTNMRLPANNQTLRVQNEAECESACLENCGCVGYSYNSGDTGCLIWSGELLNLQQLSQDNANGSTIYVRLAASEFSSNKADEHQKQTSKKLKVAIPIGVIAALLFVSCFTYIYYRKRRSSKVKESSTKSLMQNTEGEGKELINIQDEDKGNIDVPFFSLESILVATDDFSEQNKLGQGGFGPVYKGIFPGGREIAVKRLSSHSGQGLNEFKNEVILIARLQHRNLVRLLGYCFQSSEKILLYEYMANKSLDMFIFDRRRCMILDWSKRFEIIEGIARGLLYLHHDSRLRIIHRDLKTSNILLDEELNPKISDFGLARVVEGKITQGNTNKVVGTYGYMAPEYAIDGLFSTKSDVFSFGIVILEIISGRRNTGFFHQEEASNLLGHAWRLWKEDKAMDLVDQSLHESCNEEEAIKCLNIGLLCVQENPKDRPNTSNIVMMLGSENVVSLPSPNQPSFMTRKYANNNTSSSSAAKSDIVSNNELTVTIEIGR